jgi:two-component system, NarL family, response regulator NreC
MEEVTEAQHSNGKEVSIALVDPETLTREGVSHIINGVSRFNIKLSLPDAESALEFLKDLSPDILITEIALPGRSGLDLLLELKRRKADKCRVIVLSRINIEAVIRQALALGATSYVLKSDSSENFICAIERTLRGESYVSESASPALGVSANPSVSPDKLVNDPLAALSPREREIFFLLAGGDHNTIIAKKLFISPRTVETHRSRVVKKLGLNSNAELIRFAIRHGLSVVS